VFMCCDCQPVFATSVMDNLSSVVASAKAAVDVLSASMSGGKQCERIEVGTVKMTIVNELRPFNTAHLTLYNMCMTVQNVLQRLLRQAL